MSLFRRNTVSAEEETAETAAHRSRQIKPDTYRGGGGGQKTDAAESEKHQVSIFYWQVERRLEMI